MPDKKRHAPVPASDTRTPPHPDPADPQHEDWLIDEADEESFPASDPSTATQPKPTKERRPERK